MKWMASIFGSALIGAVTDSLGYGWFAKDGINVPGAFINILATLTWVAMVNLIAGKKEAR